MVSNLPAMVWSTAFFFAVLRINDKPFSIAWTDARLLFVGIGTIFFCVTFVAASVWLQRRWVQQHLLPHKRRLEGLLKELDDQ